MVKRIFFLLLISNFAFSQSELKHVVYFETSKYTIPKIEQNRLLLFILKLDSLKIEKISIYGFCDDIGSLDYNLKLSQQRANTIKVLFLDQKIKDSLISNVDGKGEILLKIINTEDANIIRSLNRKVEIAVLLKPIIPSKIEEKQEPKKSLKDSLKVGDKILLENILFKTGSSYIVTESKEVLTKIAKILVDKENIYFTIQGHVCCTKNTRDAIDSKTKKQNLSLARAKYIYNFLFKAGISKKRMKYVGMRRKFPLGGDPKFDRRVEILITFISKKKN